MRKKLFFSIMLGLVVSFILTLGSSMVFALDTGWVSASSYSNVDSVSDPERAYTQNGSNATFNSGGDNVRYGFGSNIVPTGAIIDGIEVRIDAYRDSSSSRTFDLQLFTGSTSRGSSTNSGTLPSSNTTNYIVRGSATADWGYGSWTSTNINTLGVRVTSTSGGDNAYLDHIQVKVHYHMPTYDITYNLNGGTNSVSNPATYQVITPTITLADATRTGYTFDGWYSDSGLTTEVTSIPLGSTGNKTLYAKWVINTYDITYNLDGGTNDVSNPATYQVTTPTITLADPVRLGYTFDGWYSDNEMTSEVTSIPLGSTGDIELYAKWVIDTYDVIYNLDNGTNDISNPATYQVTTPTITFADPVRLGYTFDGWYSDEEMTTEVTSIPLGSTGAVELYAKWLINTYDINYNLDSGTNDVSNPATYQVTTPTINFADPVRLGYTFDGWYSDEEMTTEVTSIPLGSTGDVELYAKWILNVYEIKYETNGGTNGSNPIEYDVLDDDIILRPPTKPGYVFGGWYDNPEFTGTAITSIPVEDVSNYTLYAKWIAAPTIPKTGQYAILIGALSTIGLAGAGLIVLKKKK